MKYQKKPLVIEAVQWTGINRLEMRTFLNKGNPGGVLNLNGEDGLDIYTLEGVMKASKGDWIIQGIHGEFYPCKPDIFELTYEAAI